MNNVTSRLPPFSLSSPKTQWRSVISLKGSTIGRKSRWGDERSPLGNRTSWDRKTEKFRTAADRRAVPFEFTRAWEYLKLLASWRRQGSEFQTIKDIEFQFGGTNRWLSARNRYSSNRFSSVRLCRLAEGGGRNRQIPRARLLDRHVEIWRNFARGIPGIGIRYSERAAANTRAQRAPPRRSVGVESCYCARIWFYINSCALGAPIRAPSFRRIIKHSVLLINNRALKYRNCRNFVEWQAWAHFKSLSEFYSKIFLRYTARQSGDTSRLQNVMDCHNMQRCWRSFIHQWKWIWRSWWSSLQPISRSLLHDLSIYSILNEYILKVAP